MLLKRVLIYTALVSAFVALSPLESAALTINSTSNTASNHDFVVGPGKVDLILNPGESAERQIIVTNRLGESMTFNLDVEDITSSSDPKQVVALLGDERGPYSLKDYVKPEVSSVTLKHGERAAINVEISIPTDAEPGGRYGSIVVATSATTGSMVGDSVQTEANVSVISRLANLFFIRIRGDVKESGTITGFEATKRFNTSSNIDFDINYQNSGNVHLLPYGTISISNIFGAKVGEVAVDPYFALPQAERWRQISWRPPFLLGYYTATLNLNLGYSDIVDEKSFAFWVLPLGQIGKPILLTVLAILIVWQIAKRLEIKIKPRP